MAENGRYLSQMFVDPLGERLFLDSITFVCNEKEHKSYNKTVSFYKTNPMI
jgi:hypothetical protein